MRHINLDKLEIQLEGESSSTWFSAWQDKAQNALEAARDAAPNKRSSVVNSYGYLWSEFKPRLAQFSDEKCWYCESKLTRDYNDVDHFRPKNRVADSNNHDGYWWLAFAWRNYRFSCTLCNRPLTAADNSVGGKQDFFPLVREQRRAMSESDDIKMEEPILLDPTDAGDPGLLWFNVLGQAVPKYDEKEYPLQYRRAGESIRIYHLNHRRITDRRKEIYREVRQLVTQGNRHFADMVPGNTAAKRGYTEVVERLQAMITKEAEYSATAKAVLLTFCRDSNPRHDWIQTVFSVM